MLLIPTSSFFLSPKTTCMWMISPDFFVFLNLSLLIGFTTYDMTLLFCLLYLFIYTSVILLLAFKLIMSYSCCSQFLLKLFCKNNGVHFSLMGLSNSNSKPSPKCGLGLIASEAPRVPNVIESSSVVNKPPDVIIEPTLTASTPPETKKKDPGGIGFIDDIGGGVDGLMSCTESLGFESCDERRVDDDEGGGGGDDDVVGKSNDHHRKNMVKCDDGMVVMMAARDACRRKRIEDKMRERINRKFPPPLSSLNQNGQPCFYLKPVRKNGRLELTEIRIQRPEILRAVRQNGRLRLHLVSSDVICSKINEEDEEENIEETTHQGEQEQESHFQEEKVEVKLQEEEKVEESWNYRMSGEGFRRCHEVVMSHHHDYNHHDYHHHHLPNINDHHHSLHVWRQPCVTTR